MVVMEIAAAVPVMAEYADKILTELKKIKLTIAIEIVNGTSRKMEKVRHQFNSGGFGTPAPPERIAPFSSEIFAVKNDFLDGVIGSISYRVEGVGDFLAGFSNPVWGDNTVNVDVHPSFDQSLSVIASIDSGFNTRARFVVTDRTAPFPKVQSEWRSCSKCHTLHFGGIQGFKGACPTGGEHEQFNSFDYAVVWDSRPASQVQAGWRSCPRCQQLHFAGNGNHRGACPAGGVHTETGSFEYVGIFGVRPVDRVQDGWRSCRRCQSLFYRPLKGVCVGGGEHDPTGSFDYVQRLL